MCVCMQVCNPVCVRPPRLPWGKPTSFWQVRMVRMSAVCAHAANGLHMRALGDAQPRKSASQSKNCNTESDVSSVSPACCKQYAISTSCISQLFMCLKCLRHRQHFRSNVFANLSKCRWPSDLAPCNTNIIATYERPLHSRSCKYTNDTKCIIFPRRTTIILVARAEHVVE